MTLVDLPGAYHPPHGCGLLIQFFSCLSGVINYGSNAEAVTDITLSHLKPLNSILIVMMPSFSASH